jgi:hypothetical protein
MERGGTPTPDHGERAGGHGDWAAPTPVEPAPRKRRRWPLWLCLLVVLGLYHRQAVDDLETLVWHFRGEAAGPVPEPGAPFTLVSTYRGRPGRWNPCEPIPWVVNLDEAPPWAMEDLNGAIRRISEASGLTFRFRGETSAVPSEQWTKEPFEGRPGWPPLIVAWADPSRTEYLDGEVAGMGGVTLVDGVVVSGFVAIDRDTRHFPRGFDQPDARSHGGLLLHELGHALGLGHVDDGDQVMAHTGSVNELAAGDLAGLRHVGAESGCLRVPPPPW